MKSPFKFLDSYTRDDREIFFGRDREIEELYHRVFESRIMLVYGVSGTGKTSLINCGLANKIRETDWLPLMIRRGSDLKESLASAIRSASVTPQSGDIITPQQFRKAVRSLYVDHYKPVYFIFDQLEELFIFGTKEEDEDFIKIIKSLLATELQCKFIFILREEFLGWLSTFEKSIPGFFTNRMRIEKMDIGNARKVIEGPCKINNISLEDGFAERMLEKLVPPKESEIELTYLQVYLDKIFRMASEGISESEEITFRATDLEKAGSVHDILGDFLDEQIGLMADPDLAMTILKAFVSARGTKRPAGIGEIVEYAHTTGKTIDEKSVSDLLISFVNLRILQEKDKNNQYELRHDALALKIFEKITLVEKEVLDIRQLIENACNSWQKREVLLSAADLDYIAPYESRLFLSDELTGFIEKSKAEIFKAKRRKRTILTMSGLALLIVFACFTIWALVERSKSKEQELIAKANYFTSLSKEFSGSDPTKAFRLAEYAYSLNPSKEIRRNLVEIYSNNEFYNQVSPERTIKCPYGVRFHFNSQTGRIGVNDQWKATVYNSDGTIWDNQFIDYSRSTIAYSPDEKSYLLYTFDDTARMFDISGKQVLKRNIYNDPRAVKVTREIGYFPDSKKFYTYNSYNKIEIWSSDGSLIANSDRFQKDLTVLPPASDNNLLICSGEGTLYKWDLVQNIISETKLDLETGLTIMCPALLNDQRIALYRSDKRICIYDMSGNLLTTWEIDYTPREMIAVVDKNLLATINDKQIIIWDYNGSKLKTLKSYSEISEIKYDQMKNRILFSNPGEILIYQLDDVYNETIFKTSNPIAFDENKGLFYEFQKGNCKVFNTTGLFQKNIQLPDNYTLSYLSATGRYIVTTTYSFPFLTVTDLENNSTFHFKTLSTQPLNISFSNDDKFILTSGSLVPDSTVTSINSYSDNIFNLWTITGKNLRRFKANSYISSLSMTNDNTMILVGAGQDAEVWDTSGVKKLTLSGHTDYVTSVDISDDGKFFLTGSWDGTTRLWSSEGKVTSIIKASVNTAYERKIVSFLKGKPYFLTFNQYSTTPIELYKLNGDLVQTIDKSAGTSDCYFYENKNSIVFYDTRREAVVSKPLKQPIEGFIIDNNHNRILDFEKIDYGILTLEDLFRSGSSSVLYEAGRYVSDYKLLDITDPKKKILTLNQAEKLFRKGLLTDTAPGKIYRRLTEIYIQKASLSNEDINEELDDFYSKMISTVDGQELFQAAFFYSGTVSEATLKYGIHQKAIVACKKLSEAGLEFHKTVGFLSSQLTYKLIELKEFPSALEAALISIGADPGNPYIITNLPLAYIFNNQYSKAENIYAEWKDKPWKEDNSEQLFRDIFMTDIIDLESKGITHPDFEKVKDLLKR